MFPQDKTTAGTKSKAPQGNPSSAKNDYSNTANTAEQNKIEQALKTAIPLAEFHQYVRNNIPYNSYVFGVGKVKYIPVDDPIVLIPDTPTPLRPKADNDVRNDPFFWSGAAWGGFSIYASWKAFDMHNSWWWTSHATYTGKEVRVSTDMLKNSLMAQRPFANNYATAVSRAKPLLKFATRLSYIGVILPIVSTTMKKDMNTEDTSDFVFACIAFVPEVGWFISGLYVVVVVISVATTGKKISTRVEETLEGLYLEWLRRDETFKAWINSFGGGYYKMP